MNTKFDDITYQIVVKHGLLDQLKLDSLLEEAKSSGTSLASTIIKSRSIAESALMQPLADELHLGYLNLKNYKIDKAVIDAVPYKFAWHYKFVPIKIENNILTVAVTYPLDIKTQDELRLHFGYDIRMVLSSEKDILEEFKRSYGLGADMVEKSSGGEVTAAEPLQEEVEDIEKLAEDASVINLVNQIILEAYKKRATDIHIEPYRGELKLRYRIDGILRDANVSVHIKKFLQPILSRIKIMANLNIVERRLPQDGRAIVKTQDQVLDLRVSFMPTPYGESVVIRILPTTLVFGIDKLGLSSANQEIFDGLISKPHGIIFVTGPTGSGKTTTLYACLSRINKKEKKIITIEDPIEYEIPGVVQIQVMPEIGLSFARGLRSMLRHDPDIIMLGEVRDLETAEIAMRAALTGHLVFSTLHTNDAAGGVNRLIDVGVESFLVASSIEAFIAQRLIRTICNFCKKEDTRNQPELKARIIKEIGGVSSQQSIKLYRGEGCEECGFTGFHGRTGIFEIMVMSDELRDLVLKKPSTKTIKMLAVSLGMNTLRQDGWRKVIEGITTPEEIMKVTQEERLDETGTFFEEKIQVAVSGTANAQGAQSPTYQNKRLFPRAEAQIPLRWRQYTVEKSGEKKYTSEFLTVTKNISAGGLLFSTKEPLPVGEVLEIKMELPEEPPVVCLARIVRIEEVQDETVYNVAVCFLDLSGADRARINKFVTEEKEK